MTLRFTLELRPERVALTSMVFMPVSRYPSPLKPPSLTVRRRGSAPFSPRVTALPGATVPLTVK